MLLKSIIFLVLGMDLKKVRQKYLPYGCVLVRVSEGEVVGEEGMVAWGMYSRCLPRRWSSRCVPAGWRSCPVYVSVNGKAWPKTG